MLGLTRLDREISSFRHSTV